MRIVGIILAVTAFVGIAGLTQAETAAAEGRPRISITDRQFENAIRECERTVGSLSRRQVSAFRWALDGERLSYREVVAECLEMFPHRPRPRPRPSSGAAAVASDTAVGPLAGRRFVVADAWWFMRNGQYARSMNGIAVIGMPFATGEAARLVCGSRRVIRDHGTGKHYCEERVA